MSSMKLSSALKRGWLAALTAATLLAMASPAAAQLQLLTPNANIPATFSGRGGFSSDALGQSGPGGQLQVEVPAGSTIEQAYLYVVGNGSAGSLIDRTITFDLIPAITQSLPDTTAGFWSARADVTAQVRTKVGANGGITSFVVGNDPGGIEGVALVAIYSNPASPTTTVMLYDGEQPFGASTLTVPLQRPLAVNAPGFQAIMSLGIGFGYQDSAVDRTQCNPSSSQRFDVDVNGTRLTSCAGHWDDGVGVNGALITMGGVGDNLNTPINTPGQDDELYDISSLLTQGDTSIALRFNHPGTDDYLFAKVIALNSVLTVDPVGDTDGDGINDLIEVQLGTDHLDADSDGDGLCDGVIAVANVCIAGEDAVGGQNTDGAGAIDALDPDDDGDGILTATEIADGALFGNDVDMDNAPNWLDTDSDDDGILDADETADVDQDGRPDYLDDDVFFLLTPTQGQLTNNTQLPTTGSTEPGAQVVITYTNAMGGVVFTQTVTANALSGDFSATPSAALPDGIYTISATVTDSTGNSATSSVSYELDATPPPLTLVTPADNTITNLTTIALSGVTAPNAMVTLVITGASGQVFNQTVTANAAGAYSANATGLMAGAYTVTATTSDLAGNTASVSNDLTIDLTPPAVAVLTPADDSSTQNTTPTLSGTAEAGSSVTVTVVNDAGATLTFGPIVAAGGMWSVPSSALAEGAYTVTATATDAAGNTASDSSDFTIDVTPPAVAVLTPADDSSTQDTTPTLSGTAEAGASVSITVVDDAGATLTFGPIVAAAGMWSVPSSALAEGVYTVTATATDAAGNTASDTNDFTIDVTPPTVTLITPADGGAINDATPSVTGTTEPNTEVVVRITDEGGAVLFEQTVTSGADGSFEATATALPEGAYTVTATATDAADNSASTSNDFTIDLTPPEVAITAPAQDEILGAREVVVTGTSDADATLTITFTDDTGAVIATVTTTADAAGAWTVTSDPLVDGAYEVSATATDVAGNSADAGPIGFTVNSQAPNLTVTSPADGDLIADGAPTLDGTTDADATITIVITDDGGATIATLNPTVNPDGTFSADVDPGLTDGDYTLTVTATGANGLTTTDTLDVTIDTQAPAVTITSPAQGATRPEVTSATGTAEPGATVIVTVDGVALDPVTADAQGQYTVTFDALADGEHTIEATATDAAGNNASATVTFTVDSSAPTITLTSPAPGATVASTQPTITGTAAPGATITVTIDGQVVGTTTADASGAWSFTPDTALAEGEHTVSASTINDAGTSASTGDVTFTISLAPDLSITSPAPGSTVTGPQVTVTGVGAPGSTVTITSGDQSVTVTVGDDGTWSGVITLPEGQQTITVTDGEDTATVTVTVETPVVEPQALVMQGGGCAQAPASPAHSAPALLLLGLGGLLLRRRSRA